MSDDEDTKAHRAQSTFGSVNPRLRWWERLVAPVAAVIGLVILRLVSLTLRHTVAIGGEHVDQLLANQRPVILTSWHNRTFVCGHFIWNGLVRRGLQIGVLVSLSRDGEIMARAATMAGLRVVRGSTTLGGLRALRALRRALTRDGWSVGTTADGSRGPVYDCKPGTVVLAQTSGAPILPMSGAADRFWRLRSWDRLIVPKPFSRLTLVIGEPIPIPADLNSDGLATRTRHLGETLTALTEKAEAVVAGGVVETESSR